MSRQPMRKHFVRTQCTMSLAKNILACYKIYVLRKFIFPFFYFLHHAICH